jgi:putative addiction module killer protein
VVQSPERAGCGEGGYRNDQVGSGNFSNVKGVGSGLFEYKIDFGPGYRVYFGKDGDRLVILLGGGAKKRQQHDISAALAHWLEYKRRK